MPERGLHATDDRDRVDSSGTSWQSIAALILAGLAVVLSVLAVWLGRPRFGRDPDQAGPETSSGAAK